MSTLRRHQETIGLWLLALIFATACVLLGRWQLQRYQDKHERGELVGRNYDAAPEPLSKVLPTPDAPFDITLQWRPVQVSGSYDEDATVLVRNRPRTGGQPDAEYGYEVVVPLRLDDGSALLVDRGWLPNGSTGRNPGRAPDSVPAPPSGRVTVVARLRPSEPARPGSLPAGQAASISVPTLQQQVAYPVYRAYGVLVTESPAATPAPAPLDPPARTGSEGINASYAAQWALFAVLGLAFPVWVRRRRRAMADDDLAGQQKAGSTKRPLEPARSPRRRIWDSDDEDE